MPRFRLGIGSGIGFGIAVRPAPRCTNNGSLPGLGKSGLFSLWPTVVTFTLWPTRAREVVTVLHFGPSGLGKKNKKHENAAWRIGPGANKKWKTADGA